MEAKENKTKTIGMRNLPNKEKKTLHISGVGRSSYNWKFCNAELKRNREYCSGYYCPRCGSESGLVNIIGLCSTKVIR